MAASSCFRTHFRRLATQAESQVKYSHLFNPKITPPIQAWVETFVDKEKELLDIVELHPRIFGVFPRIDFVSNIVSWQQTYRKIDYTCMPTRNELPGDSKKPWPQKGTGRARHGSITSPLWKKGGWARGPRGPTTSFTLKPHFDLVGALNAMLSVKLHQDDIRVVDSIEGYENENPQDLEKKFEERRWGPSVLIVDKRSIFPEPLVKSCQSLNHVNLMPTFGVNTLSLCKHETLVITLAALKDIEDKLLHQLVRVDLNNTHSKYRTD